MKCAECGKEIPPPEVRGKGTHKVKKFCNNLCAMKYHRKRKQ